MVAVCPKCQTSLTCDDSMLGNVFKCPVCNRDLALAANGTLMLAGAEFFPDSAASFETSRPGSSGNSNLLAMLAIILSTVSIILTVVCGVFFYNRTKVLAPTKYFDDVEEAAEYQFRKWVLHHRVRDNQRSYMIRECRSEALDNFKVDVISKGDYSLALWRTKINGESLFGHYWFMKNKNDVYVNHYPSEYSKYLTDDEKEWVKKMKEKVEDHEKSNSDFEWNVKVK